MRKYSPFSPPVLAYSYPFTSSPQNLFLEKPKYFSFIHEPFSPSTFP